MADNLPLLLVEWVGADGHINWKQEKTGLKQPPEGSIEFGLTRSHHLVFTICSTDSATASPDQCYKEIYLAISLCFLYHNIKSKFLVLLPVDRKIYAFFSL